MNFRSPIGASLMLAIAISGVYAAEPLKSGLEVGSKKISPFHPLNVTGSAAGKPQCLVWVNGGNPVAMIFARNIDSSLTSLVKKIDAATKANSSAKMGSFVVFLASDDDAKKMEVSLPEYAKKENIKSLVLAIDNVAGPQAYNIAKDAEVTVVLYNKRTVKANYAFRKGELNEKAVEAIVKDIPKILEKDEKK